MFLVPFFLSSFLLVYLLYPFYETGWYWPLLLVVRRACVEVEEVRGLVFPGRSGQEPTSNA
ncbi:hypothetical protein HYDPIDRAFT_118199 [Hydnomerulius pinastri MD-312]|uniref:Unplaced genomic scaffold scaffold_48, whole genome shotgun sequence n=1 Tax=Hydnomerulius pinastri MD-312 TaxID=994086 RepID=A0A0C9W9T0_9AGAM|nr:hypothetical protein HYDPIDRAFT_118199 [Hydnomerulius pinastri MD-312]